jgi:hypothetical protein
MGQQTNQIEWANGSGKSTNKKKKKKKKVNEAPEVFIISEQERLKTADDFVKRKCLWAVAVQLKRERQTNKSVKNRKCNECSNRIGVCAG